MRDAAINWLAEENKLAKIKKSIFARYMSFSSDTDSFYGLISSSSFDKSRLRYHSMQAPREQAALDDSSAALLESANTLITAYLEHINKEKLFLEKMQSAGIIVTPQYEKYRQANIDLAEAIKKQVEQARLSMKGN
jgi:hypothetical protein